MNALPVGGEQLKDELFRKRYFDDMARWGFDVACAAYSAQPLDDVVNSLKSGYIDFAGDAHRRGHPACIQIQSTLCHPSALDIAEAQYNRDNTPQVRPDGYFFASFASEKWKEFLKALATIFLNDYGYDWVVYEEPMYRVDIPGSNDRFHQLFTERFPDVEYLTAKSEDPAYLKLQKLKADVLVDFYADLVTHAKSVGAKKTGVTPSSFIPTIENTPAETLNTSCDIGRIAAIEGLDFLVARMQPDSIYAGAMRTGDDMQQSPLLYYPEALAHACGKPVMAISNTVDEHTNQPDIPLLPVEFFKKSLLASAAAAPNGMIRRGYGQRYGEDTEYMEFMSRINEYMNRLGTPVSPIGFMFSHRGARHVEPYTYETAWPYYWALAKRLLFEEKLPMRALYAEALAKSLEANPELRLVILDEHFPLSVAQSRILKQWWNAAPGRAILVFGAGVGYSSDEESPGAQPLSRAFPEILQTIGIRQDTATQTVSASGKTTLKHVSRVTLTAFLGKELEVPTPKSAAVERIFGSHGSALYTEETSGAPVIVQYSVGETLGLFCGLELSDSTAPVAAKMIQYALNRLDIDPSLVKSDSPGLLWSGTQTSYIIVVNASEAPARFELSHDTRLVWDVVNRRFLSNTNGSSLTLEPLSFALYRRLGKRSKLLDIAGATYITSITDGAGRADVNAFTQRQISFILRATPKEIRVDGRYQSFTTTELAEAVEVTLDDLSTGDHLFTIRW